MTALLLSVAMVASACGSSDGTYEIPATEYSKDPIVLKQYEEATGPVATMKTSMGDIEIMFFPEEAPKAVENFLTHAKDGYYDGISFHRVIEDFMIQGGDPNGTGSGGESIWGTPFEDEFSNNLHNFNGALSMANAGPTTNGSQFFIVQASDPMDVASLDSMADTMYSEMLMTAALDRIDVKATELDQEELELYVVAEQAKLDELLKAGTPDDFKASVQPVMDKYAEVGGTPHLDNMHTVFGQVIGGMDVVNAIAAVEKASGDKPVEPITILSIEVKE